MPSLVKQPFFTKGFTLSKPGFKGAEPLGVDERKNLWRKRVKTKLRFLSTFFLKKLERNAVSPWWARGARLRALSRRSSRVQISSPAYGKNKPKIGKIDRRAKSQIT